MNLKLVFVFVVILFSNCSYAFIGSKGPINISAQDLYVDYGTNIVKYSKNVALKQNDVDLKCDEMDIHYKRSVGDVVVANTGSNKGSIKKIYFKRNVIISRGTQVAKGDLAELDMDKNLLTVTGNVALKENNNYLEGEKIVYNVKTGIFKVSGKSNNKVQILID